MTFLYISCVFFLLKSSYKFYFFILFEQIYTTIILNNIYGLVSVNEASEHNVAGVPLNSWKEENIYNRQFLLNWFRGEANIVKIGTCFSMFGGASAS